MTARITAAALVFEIVVFIAAFNFMLYVFTDVHYSKRLGGRD